jgi:hypothetical protein
MAVRNSVNELAPVYNDALGYQGFVGLRSGVHKLRILK